MSHYDFLLIDARKIAKRLNISFIENKDDTFICDGSLKLCLKEALCYIYDKDSK